MLVGTDSGLFGGSAVSAGNDQYTKLLLHFDGPSGSKVMVDSSPAQHGVATVNGTASLLVGGAISDACLNLTGGSSTISFPNSTDWEFGAGIDFTIDWWEYRAALNAGEASMARDYNVPYSPFLLGYYGSAARLVYMSSAASTWDIAIGRTLGPIATGAWDHLAVVRKGSTFYTFKNGVLQDTWTSSLAIIANAGALSIGGYNSAANCLHGYIEELRISKGIARWIAAFTPPAKPYGPDTASAGDLYTKLLLHFDGNTGVTDSSPYQRGAATVTGSGVGPTGAQSVFGNASCVFPGTVNTYLSFPDSPDWNMQGDKTIECWVRINALPATSQAFAFISQTDVPNNTEWSLFVTEVGSIFFQCEISGTYYFPNGPTAIAINTWAHIALVYTGGKATVYVNGVGGTPLAMPPMPDMAQPLLIGAYGAPPNLYWLNGYIDEIRISSVARWTANFTPPSAPYTAAAMSSPVKLLLDMSGPANSTVFTDASPQQRGNATVVGTPKIMASQCAKFNPTSYITFPNSPDWDFGAADFTISWWEYLLSATDGAAVACYDTTTNTPWIAGYISGGQHYFHGMSASAWDIAQTAIGPVTLNSWHHWAVCRNGSTFRAFKDGVQQTSWTSTLAFQTGKTGPLGIGYYSGSGVSTCLDGYLDNFTITKKALYTDSTFTLPPAPPAPA